MAGYSSVKDLDDWLMGRVADDDDAVIDELQEEFADVFEAEELASPIVIEGTEEYLQNREAAQTVISKLQKESEISLVSEPKKKITDGLRPCWYSGQQDELGRPHGQGMLKYENSETFFGTFDHGVLNRRGRFKKADSTTIIGTWRNGFLEGEVHVEGVMGDWIEGYWKLGVPHGFQREFTTKNSNNKAGLRFAGRLFRGVRRGFCWKGSLGGGFICGQVNSTGDFTGDDIAYIYPDFSVALRGKFHKELLVDAKFCRLIGCQFERGIAVPVFSEPEDNSPSYTFDAPSRISVGSNPLVRDPWEETMVYVKESLLPQGGEGLFAKKDVKARQLICFYSGVRLKTSSYAAQNAPHSDYRIRLNADLDLDIPNDCIKLSQYCATLGHKVNHSNLPNADWTHVEHPRFGLIRGIVSTTDIKKNEEILINYHMNLGDAPMWYKMVWLRHQREFKKKNDEAIMRFMCRYYEDTGKRIELDLNGDFIVPEPQGITDLETLNDEEQEEDISELELAKKLLKVNTTNQENVDKMPNGITIDEEESKFEEIE